jgi:hypothetical protein
MSNVAKLEVVPNMFLNKRRCVSNPRTPNFITTLERLGEVGVDRNSILTQDQLTQRNEALNTQLYHALNASISHISDYLDQVQNDESLEWAQQHILNPLEEAGAI